MADLFANSDDSSEEVTLKTENDYAKRYDTWREKEELHKLEQKYGENATESDIESSDSEDDEPVEVPEKLEKDFLKTLSLLKTKDPRIYDPTFKFFADEGKSEAKKEIDDAPASEKPQKAVSSLAAAFDASDDESDTEIFTIEKPTERPEHKEDKLKEFLTGKAEKLDGESEKDLQALKALWSDPKLNEGEAFLRDYILNKRYLADEDEGESGRLLDDIELEADAETVEEQSKFERAYNFRFEEPDQEYLKRYPRTIGGTRPKDDRRARKRAEVRERKEKEKMRKMEEIARLKALKLKEIREKIEQIKRVTGNKELAFQEDDVEGEFDPAEHDRRMAAIFDEHYYAGCDEQKPVFPDLDEELEIENWDNYDKEIASDGPGYSAGSGPHCEDEDFNMDAEYDPKRSRSTLFEEIQETLGKKRRNRKRKSKLAQLLSTEKPKFDPATAQKTYDEYMEEYYKMDCEDVIGGDLPTRFKYRDVVPNSYGLTVEEILLADDKELNKWASLKKTVKYRPDNVEKGEVKTYQLKANDISVKKKLLPSLFKEIEEPAPAVAVTVLKKKKKKKKKNRLSNSTEQTEQELAEPSMSAATAYVSVELGDTLNTATEVGSNKNKKEKKRMKSSEKNREIEADNVDDISKKKKKDRRRAENYGEFGATENSVYNECHSADESISRNKRKKKRKSDVQTIEERPSKESIKNSKRKKPFQSDGPSRGKKMKFSPKNKVKNEVDSMCGLSDERLKAYGLNPKKYKNFLKHKKF